ncbi:hypothetical protein B7R54_06415 [Subtercola boreus]|uniref:Metallo-beta-lactamase domain-containing protein n=1 Tax=Subtercola boreus TaxID=120213 RepID=A0A3E0VHE7_9MICO|nr:ComEC/Rec2 family competence protein [Subtercola boreus]RFA08898.1 hypothetical protein B7R54_06415 [Subtercola boreus]TQL54120.1 competence protein ComEC [Subtercola boreus]
MTRPASQGTPAAKPARPAFTANAPTVALSDLRLVVPAACCWLVAGLLVGLPRAALAEAAGWCASVFFAASVAVLLIVIVLMFVPLPRGIERAKLDVGPLRRSPSRRAVRAGATRRGPLRTAVGTLLTATALCFAAGGLVSTSVAAQLPDRDPVALAPLLAHTVTVQLTVASAPVASDPTPQAASETQLRFTATALSVRSGSTSVEAQMPVMVFVRAGADTPQYEIGEHLEATGSLRPTDPGESVVALLYTDRSPTLLEPSPWYLGWANGLRASFRQSAVGLPGDGGQLVPGLAIGDVNLVSDDLDAQMKGSGLSHLTAVSGANCAIVVAAIMLLGGVAGLSRRARIVLSLTVMTAFVVLVTPSSSVLRAAVMATIVLVTLASGRPPKGLPALGLATIILLACDPWLARNYGLALSVLATAGLLVLAKPLHGSLSRWMPGWLSLVIAVPLAAQLACQPVLVLLTPTISTYSVPANLLAEPAAPVATVLGLVSCVGGVAVPFLAPVGAWLTWVPASWIAGVARFFATAPGSALPWPAGVAGILLVVLVSAAGLVLLLLRPHAAPTQVTQPHPQLPLPSPPRTPGPRRRDAGRTVRLLSGGVLLLTLAVYLGSTLSGTVFPAIGWPADWQIAACDIGQGDAVVVRSAGAGPDQPDRIALVDVGPDPTLLHACLDELHIEAVDLLVLTHYDLDHVGGLDAVVGRVGTVLMGPPEDARDERMATTLTAAGADVRQARRGDTGSLGDIGWKVLWPEAGTALRGNDASVTVQFSGSISSLFLGDLGEDSQRLLAHASAVSGSPGDALPDVDVVKVAHHGSADQSEPFYQAITAEVGLVSVGADNRYGHPTDRLLGILTRAGTAAYRTDLLGMIVLAPSPEGIVVWSEGQARVEARPK